MKIKYHKLFPVVLAVALSGFGVISNAGAQRPHYPDWLVGWVFSAALMYGLWHLAMALWHAEKGNRPLQRALFVALVLLVSLGVWALQASAGGKMPLALLLVRLTMGVGLMVAVQYLLKAQANVARLLVEKEQAQTETYKAQLKALRAQVDPHFLFNSLNTLRSMVHQQHGQSEEFIINLSVFYRQTLKHNDSPTLPLADELTILRSYLFLMKSRNEASVHIDIQIDPALHQHYLPTLALQLVLENCFKHNSGTSKKPLYIEVRSTGSGYIAVKNNVQPKLGIAETGPDGNIGSKGMGEVYIFCALKILVINFPKTELFLFVFFLAGRKSYQKCKQKEWD